MDVNAFYKNQSIASTKKAAYSRETTPSSALMNRHRRGSNLFRDFTTTDTTPRRLNNTSRVNERKRLSSSPPVTCTFDDLTNSRVIRRPKSHYDAFVWDIDDSKPFNSPLSLRPLYSPITTPPAWEIHNKGQDDLRNNDNTLSHYSHRNCDFPPSQPGLLNSSSSSSSEDDAHDDEASITAIASSSGLDFISSETSNDNYNACNNSLVKTTLFDVPSYIEFLDNTDNDNDDNVYLTDDDDLLKADDMKMEDHEVFSIHQIEHADNGSSNNSNIINNDNIYKKSSFIVHRYYDNVDTEMSFIELIDWIDPWMFNNNILVYWENTDLLMNMLDIKYMLDMLQGFIEKRSIPFNMSIIEVPELRCSDDEELVAGY